MKLRKDAAAPVYILVVPVVGLDRIKVAGDRTVDQSRKRWSLVKR
jgi:hypothetical protein